jgi:hypothetical protein
MRAGILLLGLGLHFGYLSAQDCPPVAHIWPGGTVSAALDSGNCRLGNGTPYAPYRLDLPIRGQIQMDMTGDAGLALILRDSSGARVDSGTSIHRALEAGNYTVLVIGRPVNGSAPGQTGAYSVKTNFTAEPGMLCSGFANIGLNQTVAATFPSAGCTAPDGSPYEAYSVTTWGAGTLTVTATSSDFTPVLTVRGADGSALTPTDSTLNAALSADSEYVIVVSSADLMGAYQITTAFTPADAETCRASKTLTDTLTDNAAITTASCFVTGLPGQGSMGGSGDQSYYNYYNLNVTTPGLVDLSAVSADFTATLYLLDAAGNVLAWNSGAGVEHAADGYDQNLAVTSGIRIPLGPGNYTVQLFSDVPSGGNYSLHYVFTPGPPQPCSAAAMAPGDAPTGQVSEAGCLTSIGWGDLYTLTLPAAGTLTLDLSSNEFDPALAIRDAQDNLVVANVDVGGVTNGVKGAHITADLPAGAYTVVAAANQGNGHYQLSSQFAAHNIPDCAYVQPLDINGGYIQRLGPGSCRGANGQPVDYYQFTLPSGGVVAAVMTSSEVDGYLTLLDSSGKPLRSDDNSYTGTDPLIVQFLPAGTYKLAARDAGSTAGGLYEVDVRTSSGPRPPFCAPKSTVPLGSTVTGTIDFGGCQYADATFADVYQINLTSDTTIDLRLNSSDFDAYLVILDAKGNVVDQDDDSGGDTNARVTRLLGAGTYYAVAKPFGDYTARGNYSLFVGQQ